MEAKWLVFLVTTYGVRAQGPRRIDEWVLLIVVPERRGHSEVDRWIALQQGSYTIAAGLLKLHFHDCFNQFNNIPITRLLPKDHHMVARTCGNRREIWMVLIPILRSLYLFLLSRLTKLGACRAVMDGCRLLRDVLAPTSDWEDSKLSMMCRVPVRSDMSWRHLLGWLFLPWPLEMLSTWFESTVTLWHVEGWWFYAFDRLTCLSFPF